MNTHKIDSFQEYLNYVEDIIGYEINLFRGQSGNYPLLPSIARNNPILDTTDLEIEMLNDLKRRSMLLIKQTLNSDWEWLVFAQHYGLKTRLLDWTSNPLIALWFACKDLNISENCSFVYILSTDNNMLIDTTESPFNIPKTRILRPSLNNDRIISQSGWFTAHKYSQIANKYVSLENNLDTKKLLTRIEIPYKLKKDFISKLSIFGVNHRTVFPDILGLCSHLNWKYNNRM